jgi:hypothetical protein
VNIENGAKIHARDIVRGMRVQNLIDRPWETVSVYDVADVTSTDFDGVTIWTVHDANGNSMMNISGKYEIADVPADGAVVEFATLPVGAYVTTRTTAGHLVSGRITIMRTLCDGWTGLVLHVAPNALAVVGEHYDATGSAMLPVGPVRLAA